MESYFLMKEDQQQKIITSIIINQKRINFLKKKVFLIYFILHRDFVLQQVRASVVQIMTKLRDTHEIYFQQAFSLEQYEFYQQKYLFILFLIFLVQMVGIPFCKALKTEEELDYNEQQLQAALKSSDLFELKDYMHHFASRNEILMKNMLAQIIDLLEKIIDRNSSNRDVLISNWLLYKIIKMKKISFKDQKAILKFIQDGLKCGYSFIQISSQLAINLKFTFKQSSELRDSIIQSKILITLANYHQQPFESLQISRIMGKQKCFQKDKRQMSKINGLKKMNEDIKQEKKQLNKSFKKDNKNILLQQNLDIQVPIVVKTYPKYLKQQFSLLFSQRHLNIEEVKKFCSKDIKIKQIISQVRGKIEIYDISLAQELQKIIKNSQEIEQIEYYQQQLCIIENSLKLIENKGFFNDVFTEELYLNVDKNLIKKSLQPFTKQFNNIFQKINQRILRIDFNPEQIAKKIKKIQKLQKMIQLIFDQEQLFLKQTFFIKPIISNLKNIPALQMFPCYKYLQSLSAQIKGRRSKDITDLIDPKNPQSRRFYPSLNSQHQEQYLKPLLLQFQSMKQELIAQGRIQDFNRQRQLINLFPTQQLREKHQDELDQIKSQRRDQFEKLSLEITLNLQEKNYTRLVDVFNEKKEFVTQENVAALAQRIEQQFYQIQLNQSDIGLLQQQLAQFDRNKRNLAGDKFRPIFSAISDGKNKIIQNLLKKADLNLNQMRWESPLIISSLKQQNQLQNRIVQLVKANKIINLYKQFVSDSTLEDHNTRISEALIQLINEYQSFSSQGIVRLGKYQLIELIRSKLFMSNIFSNVKTFLKNYATSEKIKKIFQIKQENDWLNKFSQNVKQYQTKSYQFYSTAKKQFQKTKNQIILRENFQIIKNSFQFLISMEQIKQKLNKQEEFYFSEVIICKSCIEELRILIDSLFLDSGFEINNYKPIYSEHNLQKTIFFSQFLSLWEDQHHKIFTFVHKSYIQLKETLTTKLEYLVEQAHIYTNGKYNVSFTKEDTKRYNMKGTASSASLYLNILILFQELKERIKRYQSLINQKMNEILWKIPSLPNNFKIALNQQLVLRQKQPYISILCTNYKQFKHIKQIQFSQKTKVKVQQYLQKFLKENKGNKKFYEQSLNIAFRQYQASIALHKQNPNKKIMKVLIDSIKSNVSNLPVQRIIGKLFGLYAIIKKENSCSITYFQPHISQVIAIITLLNIDQITLTLQNNLVQIQTGQGKSIVLGICACYLALKGFQVYHSCYSPILVHRDKMEFWELYKQLEIENKVFYGSFEETCQKILPNQFIEFAIEKIRQTNLSLWWTQTTYKIKDKFRAKLKDLSPTKKVLLLDEVDVLLSPDYYNKLYIPTIDITDSFLESKGMTKNGQDLITTLFIRIYHKIKENTNFDFQNIDQFGVTQKIIKLFPQIKEILFHIMKEIIFAARNKSKIKQIIDNKLSFKDKLKSQTHHSYQQLMAGVAMYKAGNISYSELKGFVRIRIKLYEFAYSELPKYFSSIIGASGTLKTLTQRKQRTLIDQYQVNNLYHLPTIYKDKKFNSQRIYFEKSKSHHLQTLTQIITNHFDKKGDRAVLVLFEDSKGLKQFKQSLSFKKICEKYVTNILIFNKDNFNYAEVSNIINKATLPNTITLATKQFGRGIDFKDEVGLEQGLLLVIIAYLPDSQQEYIQAKGRTARAGKTGKVFLCVHEQQEINAQYEENGLRRLFINKQQAKMNEIKDSIESVRLRHKNSQETYTDHQISVVDYLEKINKFEYRTIQIILGIQIALQDREQILKQFVEKIKTYLLAYYQSKNFQIHVNIFAYGNYIDLNRQMTAYEKQSQGKIQSKSQSLGIDEILQFNKKIITIKQNKTKTKGESVELFFKYVKDRSRQDKIIDHVYLFCSKQNLSWSRFIQTTQYKRLIVNKKFLENYKQKQPCIKYLKRMDDKTSLNIFCFNTVDRDVRLFYEDLKKQSKCINQLQFISKEQFKLNVDLYCDRSIGQTMKNIPNKK